MILQNMAPRGSSSYRNRPRRNVNLPPLAVGNLTQLYGIPPAYVQSRFPVNRGPNPNPSVFVQPAFNGNGVTWGVNDYDARSTRDSQIRFIPNRKALTEAHLNLQDQILKCSHQHSTRPRSSSIVTNPYEDAVPEDTTNRATKARPRSGKFSKSPTPSIKRGKAEKLIKEHGSPPGIRVTAGGRIVPDGFSPLNSPLMEYPPTFSQEHTNQAYPQFSNQSGVNPLSLNGFVVSVGNGSLCQVVDGHLRPIEQHNGVLQLYMPAPNLTTHPDMRSGSVITQQQLAPLPSRSNIPVISANAYEKATPTVETGLSIPTFRQIQAMEQTHTQLQQDLKNLNRNEVLQRGSLTQAKRDEIVRHRVELVNRIDESRKFIASAKKIVEQHQEREAQVCNSAHFNPVPPLQNATSGHSVPIANSHNLNPGQPFQMDVYDPNGYITAQQSFPPPNVFEIPEFVPGQTADYGSQVVRHPPVLQRRAGNIGLGLEYDTTTSHGSTETMKPSNFSNGMASMNLDGSAHQPRRSRAIEIKNPNEIASGLNHELNPASPTYRPCNNSANDLQGSLRRDEISNHKPSESTKVERLDPNGGVETCRAIQKSSTESHPSESSATTGDFFPSDSYKYSNKKPALGKRDGTIDLSAWLPQAGEPRATETDTKMTRPPTKFMFNEDSPASEHHSHAATIAGEKASLGNLNPSDSSSPYATPQKMQKSGLADEVSSTSFSASRGVKDSLNKQPSTYKLLQKASERAASLSVSSDRKTESYWEGYKTGIRQDIINESGDENYRFGYRDGLMRSCKVSEDAMTPRKKVNGIYGDAASAQPLKHSSLVHKATSFPLFGVTNVSPVPDPPANSLATTPVQSWSAGKEFSSMPGMTVESPTAVNRYMPRQNIWSSVPNSQDVATQTSGPLHELNRPISPLTERSRRENLGAFRGREYLSFASHKTQRDEFERQRCQKSVSSVAQTNESARGYLRSQYDGSADDDEDFSKDGAAASTPTTPQKMDKGKAKAPGSPMKAKASAAVATMKQVANLGAKKDDSQVTKDKKKQKEPDPALMSSPEKKNWCEYWGRKFNQLKKDEKEEIEKYKRDNPVSR